MNDRLRYIDGNCTRNGRRYLGRSGRNRLYDTHPERLLILEMGFDLCYDFKKITMKLCHPATAFVNCALVTAHVERIFSYPT